MRSICALALCALLVACGGGGSEEPPTVKRTNILFLGNSLTIYPTNMQYLYDTSAWSLGGWGATASVPEKDYAHLVAAAQGLPFVPMNISDIERDKTATIPAFSVGPGTVVVVQLGDNGLPAKYAELIQLAKVGAKLVCVSTWWNDKSHDGVMRPICEAAGGSWVYIGDVYPDPSTVGFFNHPNDAGMAMIAARINKALGV